MKTVEFNESEQLALLAELARPLVHESNNFLNNLFLHMTLFQDHLPTQLKDDWESVRQRASSMEFLLREMAGLLARLCRHDRENRTQRNDLGDCRPAAASRTIKR